jgi:hypothetical protein
MTMTRPSGDDGAREFRTSIALRLVSGVSLLLFAVVAITLYALNGWTWMTLVAIGLLAFAAAGVADVLTMRVVLNPESIVIVRNLRRREYPRGMFVKATWAKGVPVSLQREDGTWVHLPGVGTSSQGMVNTLRAWIAR